MHRNPSVMKHTFSEVPKVDIPRSTFDRSHGHKTTFDSGYLVRSTSTRYSPGDTFNCKPTIFARLSTPIFPVMDNMYLDTQLFAVPVRLLWDNWQRFNGEQIDPGDSTDFTIPQIVAPAGGYPIGSLSDYMGLPTGVAGFEHSALWHRAYNLIWNQWYRDQNMQDSLPVPRGDGPDLDTLFTLQRRGKRHDYFTASLPFPQKGQSVSIPLGTTAPVVPGADPNDYPQFRTGTTGPGGLNVQPGNQVFSGFAAPASPETLEWFASGLVTDLAAATAATINTLRQAFAVQQIFEQDARGGTRYTEVILGHFRVKSPDARLQRPEYLGGSSTPINIAQSPQTSATGAYAASPQGNLAAMGTALSRSGGFTMSFTEHCVIIGVMSVRADLTYQQGLNKMWSRKTRFDFYWPALAHIGEQAVLQKEIFCDGTPNDEIVFGFQERHAEYRYKPSIITGLMRSSAPQSLDAWHLSQDFATAPVLDAAFIQENPPIDRVIAVTDEPQFIADIYINLRCARPMPVYGVPGMTRL